MMNDFHFTKGVIVLEIILFSKISPKQQQKNYIPSNVGCS
jgi:hypothetical protein